MKATLDTSLFKISQLVRGTSSLVRLGSQSPGWEAVATDFLELLVALVGHGHGEVEGAVVGGLAAVVAHVRPSALREGSRCRQFRTSHNQTILSRLGELLLEAVAWAGGLEGYLGEAGKQVAEKKNEIANNCTIAFPGGPCPDMQKAGGNQDGDGRKSSAARNQNDCTVKISQTVINAI